MAIPNFRVCTVTQASPVKVRDIARASDPSFAAGDWVGGLSVDDTVLVALDGNLPRVISRLGGTGTSNANLVIDPMFQFNQAGVVSGASVGPRSYFLDMWKNWTGATTNLITWVGDNETGRNLTLGDASNYVSIAEVLEKRNVPAGTYTLSWDGNASARLYNVGGAFPAGATSPLTVTLDGTDDVRMQFTGAGKTVGNVKLERGPVATPFVKPDYATESVKVFRHFKRLGGEQYYERMAFGVADSGTLLVVPFTLATPMRAIPTITASGLAAYDGATVINVSAPGIDSGSTNFVEIHFVSSGLTAFRPYRLIAKNSLSAYLQFDARL